MWKIVYVRLLNLKSNYKPYILMLILPILFTFFFGAANGSTSKVTVPFVDNDKTKYSAKYIDEIENSYNIKLTYKEDLMRMVREDIAAAGVIIPQKFGEKIINNETPKIELVIIKETPTIYSIEGILRSSLQKMSYNIDITESIYKVMNLKEDKSGIKNRIYNLVSEKWKEKPVSVNSSTIKSNDNTVQYDGYSQGSLGFTLSFVMFTFIFAVGEILEDKKNKTWERLIISPLNKLQIYLGNLFFAFILGYSQILLLILFGSAVFNVNWGSNILAVLIILAAFTFSIVSLGLMLSQFVKTDQQLQVISPIIIISTSMLGGCYWPLEIVNSKLMLAASNFVPQGWAMKGLKSIIIYGQDFQAAVMPSLILIMMGILFLGVSVIMDNK